jgi:hypothetical protein
MRNRQTDFNPTEWITTKEAEGDGFTPGHRAHTGLSVEDRPRHMPAIKHRLRPTHSPLSCPNPIDFHADL